MSTNIEWTDKVWNVVTGCTKVSAGCANCYAERYACRRLSQEWKDEAENLVDDSSAEMGIRLRRFSDVRCHPGRLNAPLRWRKPRRIFVCSMGDLFHESVPDGFIDKVFAVMALCPHHTCQILTKRPQRMLSYLSSDPRSRISGQADPMCSTMDEWYLYVTTIHKHRWPLPNVHLGVSVENQATADERIPILMRTPAAVRFVLIEPMLGPVHLDRHLWYIMGTQPRDPLLDWCIVGGESGPKARPMHPDWARSVRDQCVSAGVPFFFKQWGDVAPESQLSQEVFVRAVHGGIGAKYAGDSTFHRVGKKAAGRLLDGREWRQLPE